MDSNEVSMDAIKTVEPTLQVGPPHGLTIRGRYFVAPFVVGLLILLAMTLSIGLQFQTIMRQLDESRTLWPAASSELSRRYAQFDRSITQGSSETSSSGQPGEDQDKWSAEYAAFRETTQYDRQCPHAMNLERFLRSSASASQSASVAPFPHSEAIDRFLQSEQRRIAAQSSTIGRWTIFCLRLKLPKAFSEGG